MQKQPSKIPLKPCPVCGSALISTGKRYFLDEIFALWRPIEFSEKIKSEHAAISSFIDLFVCRFCELEIFLPQIIGRQSFYEAVSGDPKTGSPDYYEDSKWDFSEAIQDIINCSSVIEFGCGPGNFLEMAKAYVQDVAGVELNPLAAKMAESKGIQIYETEKIPEDKLGYFDSAVCFHVLEHVADPKKFLKNLSAYIKPGGIISISVPNQNGPIRYIQPCAMNMPPHHATRWKFRTFEVLAECLGWNITRVAYEPLLLENHSYYSIYWPQHIIPGSNMLTRAVRQNVSLFLRAFFTILRKFGLRYFKPLHGQSIYVNISTSMNN